MSAGSSGLFTLVNSFLSASLYTLYKAKQAMFLFLGCLVSSVLKILYLFLYAIFKVHRMLSASSGDGGIRTLDPLLARQVLSQLSYTPISGNPAATCSPMPSPA